MSVILLVEVEMSALPSNSWIRPYYLRWRNTLDASPLLQKFDPTQLPIDRSHVQFKDVSSRTKLNSCY